MAGQPPPYSQATGYPPYGQNPAYPPGYTAQGQYGPAQPQYGAYGQPQGPGPVPNTGFAPQPQAMGGAYAGAYAGEPKPEEGNTTGSSNWQSEDWAGSSFSDKAIRRAFIRKVYLLLFAQLAVTFAVCFFFLLHEPTRKWVKTNFWIYYIAYGVFLVTYIALVCCPTVRRKSPGNFIALAIFTLAFSYVTGMITSFYHVNSVLICLGVTMALCIAISIFSIQTKIDFTMCTGLLFVLVIVVFMTGIACMIVYFISYEAGQVLYAVYGGLAALLFGLFLAYDTQMLVGGRKHELSPEEYIYGSLQLYLDVVYLFLIILSCFGKSN